MKAFMDKDFLLSTDTAKKLFHEIAEPMPVLDYHCHINPEEILRLTKSDKKMDAGKIKFILLKKVGKAVIDTSVTDDDIRNAIKEIYFSDEDMTE